MANGAVVIEAEKATLTSRSRIVVRLERFMVKHDLTMEKAAGHLGISGSQISRWFSGDSFPSIHSRRAITRLLKKKNPGRVWRD